MKIAIGIVGTAKNTGKTTTAVTLLNYFYDAGVPVGLTSIGFDGERLDNVTGLPKPRFFVRRGVLVATAEKCLGISSAGVKVLARLGIGTPLGEVVGVRVEREGLLVTAGPSQTKHLQTVIDYLHRQGGELVIVDGALNRIVPMAAADGLILATGAAYHRDIFKIALEARYVSVICNRPKLVLPPEGLPAVQNTVIWNKQGEVLAQTAGSLFKPEQLKPLAGSAREALGFYCPGVVMPLCLPELLQMPFPAGATYVFADPPKLIVGGDLAAAHNFLEALSNKGGRVGYRRLLPLLAVTVNPFYPRYRYETHQYQPAYVDKEQLLFRVSTLADLPVFNVVAQGGEKLAWMVQVFAQKLARH